jgi:hypothetical protein
LVRFLSSKDQLADIFNKPLVSIIKKQRGNRERKRERVGGREIKEKRLPLPRLKPEGEREREREAKPSCFSFSTSCFSLSTEKAEEKQN